MARSATPGQPALTFAGVYDQSAQRQLQNVLCQGAASTLVGTVDPIAFPGNTQVNSAGVNAMTLATPLAGDQPAGDDGKTVFVVDLNGAAHTITTAANKIINSKHIATFNGTIGSNVTLRAMGGIWVPISLAGVTIS
jgi:hypothetical protein